MSKAQHPAVAAREQRVRKIRARIATAAVAVFVAIFSVIYAQTQTSASVATAQQPADDGSAASSDDGAVGAAPTPMTSAQS
jgi:hypothetical protein